MSGKQILRELALVNINSSIFGDTHYDDEGMMIEPDIPAWWIHENIGTTYSIDTLYNHAWNRDIVRRMLSPVDPYYRDSVTPNPMTEFNSTTDSLIIMKLDKEKTYSSVIGHRLYGEDRNYFDNYQDFPNAEKPKRQPALLLPVKVAKTINSDGKEVKIYSEYSQSTLSYFSDPVDLTGCALDWTLKAKVIVQARESPYARNKKFLPYVEKAQLHIDYSSSFSCFSEPYLSKQVFMEKAGNQKIKSIKLSSLYRGGDGKVDYTITDLYPQKITKGACIFPYLRKITVLNQETLLWEDAILYCMGIFEPLDKIMKYRRAKDFLPKFLKEMEAFNGLKLFNPEKYKKEMNRIYGPHIKYWNGISSLYEEIPKDAKVVDYSNPSNTLIDAKTFSYVTHASKIRTSQEVGAYNAVTEAYSDLQQKLKAKEKSVQESKDNIQYYNRELESLQRRIESYKKQISDSTKIMDASTAAIDGFKPALEELKEEKAKALETYNKFYQEMDHKDITGGVDYINNLKKTGIEINHIEYKNVKESTYHSLIEEPSIALKVTENKSSPYILNKVEFVTTKPTIIRVDQGKHGPENCKKIVGGPYRLIVTSNKISVALAGSTSCFGINKTGNATHLFVHPHCQSRAIGLRQAVWSDFSSAAEGYMNACLGEGAPGLYKAFERNDPKMVIFAAMTWLTNANSADAWGKNWKYFPTIDEVNLEGKEYSAPEEEDTSVESMLNTEEGIERIAEIAEELIQNLDLPQAQPIPRQTIPILTQEEIIYNQLVANSIENTAASNTTVPSNLGNRGYRSFLAVSAATNRMNHQTPGSEQEIDALVRRRNTTQLEQADFSIPISDIHTSEIETEATERLIEQYLIEQLSATTDQ